MRRFKLAILFLCFVFLLSACAKEEDFTMVSLDSKESKGCYGYGMLLAMSDKASGVVVNGSFFARGILDYAKGDLWYDFEKANRILDEFDLEYTAKGKQGDKGKEVTSLKKIGQLSPSDDIFLGFSYLWGYLNSPAVYAAYSDIDLYAFISGYYSVLYEKESLMSESEANKAFSEWSVSLMEKINKEKNEKLERNLKEAEDFLSSNQENADIIVLNDKLQLKKLESVASGESASNASSVIVDYKLSLLDGSVVDQGNDVTFSLDSLIPGFVQAVKSMNVGERTLAYIHPDLGYGPNDLGDIGPNSLLIFDITLKSVN